MFLFFHFYRIILLKLILSVCVGRHALYESKQRKEMRQEITLEQLQETINQWVGNYGVRYFSELTNLAVLVEEVGELARIMSRKFGDQSFKEEESGKDLADELADVLFVLVCIANQTGVDLTRSIQKNLEKKTERDKDRHHRNPKLKNKS